MTMVIMTYIICDICEVEFGKDNLAQKAGEQRARAKELGWSYKAGVDMCGICHEKHTKKYNRKNKAKPQSEQQFSNEPSSTNKTVA